MKIISLGMGVQSTALWYMSSNGLTDEADYSIFADTGAEKQATLEYYEKIININGIPLIKIAEKNIYNDLMKQTNSSGNKFASIPAFTGNGTGMLRRQCTAEYKISQVDKAIKKLYGLSGRQRFPKTEIWYGITQDEMHRMSIPQQKWKINVYPFIGYRIFANGKAERFNETFYTRNDIVNYYQKERLPIPIKSSCFFCPYQSNKNWLFLKNVYPNDFKKAVKVDKKIRNSSKRGIKEPIYLHRSCKPIDQVDFSQPGDLFNDECSGNCMI